MDGETPGYEKLTYRELCHVCQRPKRTCYCSHVQSFDPKIRFVILIHGKEARKRIATGRLAHRCLENSELISGYNYSHNARVNEILQSPRYHCVILYPGAAAVNLSERPAAARAGLFPQDKEPVVFVIDGTWITARKTVQRSTNLHHLPQICFAPSHPSRFRVRKQPQENFHSTVEAIHQAIELLAPGRGFALESRQHDRLLAVFDHMVEQQIELAKQPKLFCHWSPRAT